MTEKVTESVEDFLKAVYILQQKMERVSTNALADALGIAAPSVTDMARRMVNAGLVDYRKYYGVILTDKGEAVALRVIRRHRLIETYLVEALGYELHEVHTDAEQLEHVVSDRFIEAIVQVLNDPRVDPHGDPIPRADGTISRREMIPLTQMEPDQRGTVGRLLSDNQDILQHVLERGFKLGARIAVIEKDPFDGPIKTDVDGERCVIGHNVAAFILVEVDL